MTIDSGWVKILKANVPRAFSEKLPARPGTVFIDGQIKLMKGEHVRTWKQFIEQQFYATIDRLFLTGAHTVVLGFDNYQYVPVAKNMTQRKRSQHVPAMNFTQHDELPEILPEYWDAAMRNRSFKVKVMAMVANNVRKRYETSPRTVILDCMGPVEVLGHHRPLPAALNCDVPLRRGECDIKAFSYVSPEEPLLISSTDGDFVPLALMQIERALQAGSPPPRIILFRIKVSMPDSSSSAKRKRGFEMEYVDVNAIYEYLEHDLRVQRPAECFVSMVAVTGCDFTMNLPQLGPTRLWTHRHMLTGYIKDSGPSPEGILGLMLRAYIELFLHRSSLTRVCTKLSLDECFARFDEMATLVKRSSKVSQRMRDALWTSERALAHARNTFWTVLYWTHLHQHPDPMSGDYGFLSNNGVTEYASSDAAPGGSQAGASKGGDLKTNKTRTIKSRAPRKSTSVRPVMHSHNLASTAPTIDTGRPTHATADNSCL